MSSAPFSRLSGRQLVLTGWGVVQNGAGSWWDSPSLKASCHAKVAVDVCLCSSWGGQSHFTLVSDWLQPELPADISGLTLSACLVPCTPRLSPCFFFVSPHPSPCFLCHFLLSCPPSSPLHFCCIICRYISPHGPPSVLPSVWGNAAPLWRPQLSAQSLFLFLLPRNPSSRHLSASPHTPDLRALLPPSRSHPAKSHTVRFAHFISPHPLSAPSAPPAQRSLLLSIHSPRPPSILLVRLASAPEIPVPPPFHVLPCPFCAPGCRPPLLFFLLFAHHLLLIASICSALLSPTASSTT